MGNKQVIRFVMDDVIFHDRNQAYGAYLLRRIYDRNMSKGIFIGIGIYLLLICSPLILQTLKSSIPIEPLIEEVIYLRNPDFKNSPRIPPAPKNNPMHLKDQIKLFNPVVENDDEVKENYLPPTNDEIVNSDISNNTSNGVEGGSIAGIGEGSIVGTGTNEESAVALSIVEPFVWVEQMPEFPDGIAAMYDFIRSNLTYPSIARENWIEGTVVVQFVITNNGEISKVKVVRSIGGGCDEEAIRVVSLMPKWRPGKHNGVAVPVIYNMPIRFKLKK